MTLWLIPGSLKSFMSARLKVFSYTIGGRRGGVVFPLRLGSSRYNTLNRGTVALLRVVRALFKGILTTKHANGNDADYDPEESSTAAATGARATAATKRAAAFARCRAYASDLTTVAVVSSTLNLRTAPTIRIVLGEDLVRLDPDVPLHGVICLV